MKMRIYLAGPMRGRPHYNFPAFFAAAKTLRAQGHEVWSPAEGDIEKDGFDASSLPNDADTTKQPHTMSHYMERDLPEVCKADAICLLEGWEKSEGCAIEVIVARKLGKRVISYETGRDIPGDFKPTNPKDVAAIERLDLSLFPATAIAYGALGMTEGDCKYGGYNYRVGGVLTSVYIAALLRHTFKFFSGQWEDERTKVPHLASMISCCAILIDAHECGVLTDDRPPKTNLNGTFEKLQKVASHLKSIFKDGPGRFTEEKNGNKNQ